MSKLVPIHAIKVTKTGPFGNNDSYCDEAYELKLYSEPNCGFYFCCYILPHNGGAMEDFKNAEEFVKYFSNTDNLKHIYATIAPISQSKIYDPNVCKNQYPFVMISLYYLCNGIRKQIGLLKHLSEPDGAIEKLTNEVAVLEI